MAENVEKVRFKCPQCGCRLSVPSDRAGRRGKCPRCQERLTVPEVAPSLAATAAGDARAAEPNSGSGELALIAPVLDSTLLDLQRAETQETEPDESHEACEQIWGTAGRYRLKTVEEPPSRSLPWIIDIFLFPLNVAGVSMLMICVALPFVVRIMSKALGGAAPAMPLVLLIWPPVILIHWTLLAGSALYMIWYVCECMRDSAGGSIRATETRGTLSGFWDVLAQSFQVGVCVFVTFGPAIIYWRYTHRADLALWVLYGVGAFLMPMVLLAVVVHESLTALNPRLWVGAIFRTFVQHIGLAILCAAVSPLFVLWPRYILHPAQWYMAYLLEGAGFYAALVLAHLLGRFYWKYQEQLF